VDDFWAGVSDCLEMDILRFLMGVCLDDLLVELLSSLLSLDDVARSDDFVWWI